MDDFSYWASRLWHMAAVYYFTIAEQHMVQRGRMHTDSYRDLFWCRVHHEQILKETERYEEVY